MNFNFELILFYVVLACGVLSLIDIFFFAGKRRVTQKKMPIIFEYARSFFPVLLFVFLLRSFLFETFWIPSGSLEPTLLVGDFIAVNKFAYGIRLPVTHQKIFEIGEPKRGDIFVFRYPPIQSYDLIKRVIGLPGDHISYINKQLYVNGEKISQEYELTTTDQDEAGNTFEVVQKQENLLGVKHGIFQTPNRTTADFKDIIVPKGMYFALGDNRDESADSRYWGFVPDENIVGRADIKWMSWDSGHHTIRWSRLFRPILSQGK